MSKIKLFCIPYAGGSAMIYKSWERFLNGDIELVPVELAGRGKRSNEPMYKNVNEAIDDVYNIISKQIYNCDSYAIFGHSMGGMLTYKVTQKLRSYVMPAPMHVFFSGRVAPHMKYHREKPYHLMEDEEFKEEVIKLGGTPQEFFDYPELMEYLLPILKNDFMITESVLPQPDIDPIESNITVFYGKEEAEVQNVYGWMLHTRQMCSVHLFNGGHFFINDETERIVGVINKTLTSLVLNPNIK